jgi:hypothetical protein
MIKRKKRRVVTVRVDGHPRAHKGDVLEHIIIAERALGRYLPEKAEVHHFDEDPMNNDPKNLIICQNRGYHSLLHQRMRALKACGNPAWRICSYCRSYDSLLSLVIRSREGLNIACYHKKCRADYERNRSNRSEK